MKNKKESFDNVVKDTQKQRMERSYIGEFNHHTTEQERSCVYS